MSRSATAITNNLDVKSFRFFLLPWIQTSWEDGTQKGILHFTRPNIIIALKDTKEILIFLHRKSHIAIWRSCTRPKKKEERGEEEEEES